MSTPTASKSVVISEVVEFDTDSKIFFLDMLDKAVDKDGYIIEKDTGKRVLTPYNEEIKFEEFAAYRKGSELFFKSDITYLIDLVEDED